MDSNLDLFESGKSNEQAQIDNAITLLTKKEYRVIKTAEEAKKVAIEFGYKVSDPIFANDKIVTLKDLRNYFYMKLSQKYPRNTYMDLGWQRELRMLKLFVESRESTGLNKFNAIQECVAIIDVIFDHETEFGFKTPIDIRVLGQGKLGWITQKALSILNNKIQQLQEQSVDKLIERKDIERKIDLKSKALELDELVKEMEANNG